MVNVMHRLVAMTVGKHSLMVPVKNDRRVRYILNRLVDEGYLLAIKPVYNSTTGQSMLNAYLRYTMLADPRSKGKKKKHKSSGSQGHLTSTAHVATSAVADVKLGTPALRGVKIYDTPGKPTMNVSLLHLNLLAKRQPHVTYFVQTSKGDIVTHRTALKLHVGGALLMSAW
jgi:hypothetical protein